MLIKAQVLMMPRSEVKSTFDPIGFNLFHMSTAHRSLPSVKVVQKSECKWPNPRPPVMLGKHYQAQPMIVSLLQCLLLQTPTHF